MSEKKYTYLGQELSKNEAAKFICEKLDAAKEIVDVYRLKFQNKLEVHSARLDEDEEGTLSEEEKLTINLAKQGSAFILDKIKSAEISLEKIVARDDYVAFVRFMQKGVNLNLVRQVTKIFERMLGDKFNDEMPESVKVEVYKSELQIINADFNLIDKMQSYNNGYLHLDDEKDI